VRTLGALLVWTFLLPNSSSASEALSLAPLLTHGLADGARIMIYGVGTATVAKTGDASYSATFDASVDLPEGPAIMRYSFRETEACRVEVDLQLQGPEGTKPPFTVTYDFTQLTHVVVQQDNEGAGAEVAEAFDLSVVKVGYEPEEVAPKEYQMVAGYLFTSIGTDEYVSAAKRLEQLC
jgi:hypothetical protein